MTTLVTRAEWGARTRKQGTTDIDPRNGTTVHYEGEGWSWPWDHSTCASKVRAMQADHMDNKGWSDIAYNYLGCPHDYLYEGRGFDRRSSANGYEEANATSFAVQGIWGEKSGKPPEALKRAIRFAIDLLREKGGANNELYGHRDWKSTSCPGDYLYAWVQNGCPLPQVGEIDMTTDASVRAIVREELAASVKDGGALHELVQMYAAFGAKHSDQLVDDTGKYAGQVADALSQDDFAKLSSEVAEVKSLLETLIATPKTTQ